MRGIFGAVAVSDELIVKLQSMFERFVGTCEARRVPGGVLGAARAGSGSAFLEESGDLFVVDGEAAHHPRLTRVAAQEAAPLFQFAPDGVRITENCRGNLALVRPSGHWFVACEATGSFPLYHARVGAGWAFSSSFRAIAALVDAPSDGVGSLEMLLFGYTLRGRTVRECVARALPGEVLGWHGAAGRLERAQRTRLWCAPELGARSDRDPAQEIWTSLREAIDRSRLPAGRIGLMMSAGWDSRTLLAALREHLPTERLLAYTHGDVRSRELAIVRRLCKIAGIKLHEEPIVAAEFDPKFLQAGFDHAETVLFPHWIHAGRRLRELGVEAVSAGTYGEVLGGHYGPAMLRTGMGRVAEVAGQLLKSHGSDADPRSLLLLRDLAKPWYLAEETWRSVKAPLEAINADIEGELADLATRGVHTPAHVVEAFVAEHRGSQFINAQILSCRASLDVFLPYIDRSFLELATNTAYGVRIHNRLNRRILKRFAPDLAGLPMAATLVSAGAPILVQESSRVIRKVFEECRWFAASRSGGRIERPRLGWLDFEFLSHTSVLDEIVADLRCDFWDRPALAATVRDWRNRSPRQSIHPLAYQLLRVANVDLMLR